jgi:hypothetical protein
MRRMAELIRKKEVPASMVRRAARGELSLPPGETVEILVLLAADGELGAEAQMTLAAMDEELLSRIGASAETAPEVLRHLSRSHAGVPQVVAALCSNPSLGLQELGVLASAAGAESVQAMLQSERVRASIDVLDILEQNPASVVVRAQLEELRGAAAAGGGEADAQMEAALAEMMTRHAHELEEDEKPFALVTAPEGEEDPLAALMDRSKRGSGAATEEEAEQLSVLQKIASMRVGERIKLAMRGSREERMILIRDRSKLVATAVLASPKVNESEMENFAAMKNIQEAVLRAIASNRKNIKLNGVVRALVNNPKTPLDVSLPLLPHLMLKDLRTVGVNKNVNETIRKLAMKMFRTKTEKKG